MTTPNETKTPKTDEQFTVYPEASAGYVPKEFARTLECELAEAKEKIDGQLVAIRNLKSNIAEALAERDQLQQNLDQQAFGAGEICVENAQLKAELDDLQVHFDTTALNDSIVIGMLRKELATLQNK